MYPHISLSSSYLSFFFLLEKLQQSLSFSIFPFASDGAKLLYHMPFILYFSCYEWVRKRFDSHVSDSLRPHGLQPIRVLCPWEILQARILEWVAISFSRGSSQPRDQNWVSRIAGGRFTIWATREAPNRL